MRKSSPVLVGRVELGRWAYYSNEAIYHSTKSVLHRRIGQIRMVGRVEKGASSLNRSMVARVTDSAGRLCQIESQSVFNIELKRPFISFPIGQSLHLCALLVYLIALIKFSLDFCPHNYRHYE